ncbi:hypothetical protein [Tenacibaculum retecalamus]|uniref:hypothetical protein n=1 Tax=Tenacibaculum retecalamus TaxID=3018315 RepID=UPI0023D96867|nr:hypothetical protein [Tenacibaculum retecalamus]WBX71082.1 hypothetical protein PG912_12860 [Tenacibaculum retecalamus]
MNRKFGYFYATIMAVYFLVSGLSVLFDVPGKLKRIDLQALNVDGEIAFILIYTSLMVGIGIANVIFQFISKSWVYSAILSVIIISSFIVFRIVGSLMIGNFTNTQISFLVFEIIEVAIGLFLLKKNQIAIYKT